MNSTLKNLTKLRIAGMLSDEARIEAERKILEHVNPEIPTGFSDPDIL